YTLAKEYSGTDFFQGWDYYGAPDLLVGHHDLTEILEGDVNWVNETQAVAEQLAYVNDAGNAIIKADNTTNIPNQQKRDTIRVTSQDSFTIGSVFVIDATHLPFGCSVWPSIWTTDSDPKVTWPDGGEIDIIETVNQMTTNQYSLHTSGTDECTGVNSTTEQSGTLTSANCYPSATDDDGCAVLETAPDSVGPAFAAANGGVYAAQFDTSGIFIWFWSRADISASVSSANEAIDVSGWGRPSAAFPASSCDITQKFGPQALVIDITLCGTWAGEPSIYSETCPVTAGTTLNDNTCYASNVIGNGTNYADAYFEIQYIKAFTWNG
ncbi:glycoside hydrolase family 16 protein, partial [Daedalea quercina L-15889]